MRLTFSKLDTYNRCPLRFRFRYHEKLPEAPRGKHNLSLILHRALEAFLLNARRDSSLGALLQAYDIRSPQPTGSNRLLKKGVSVKLPCRWSQEHDDVRL